MALRRQRGAAQGGRADAGAGRALAAGTTGAVVAVEFARVWKRGRAPLPTEADEPLQAAAEAAAETAEVAIVGYREASTRENALFNLLASFVVTFITVRAVTYLLRERPSVGPVPQPQGRDAPHPPLRARDRAGVRLRRRGHRDPQRDGRSAGWRSRSAPAWG